MSSAKHTERFAPSPTGPLHLGHAFSAITAWERALAAGGDLLLRIEDIDQSRARPEWEAQIYDDLRWLGISWPTPVLRQSDRLPAYRAALETLWRRGLLYPCTCSRRDIEAAASAPQEGVPTHGPDGRIYPGTCRFRGEGVAFDRVDVPDDVTLRLNMSLATAMASDHRATGDCALSFIENGPKEGLHKIHPENLLHTVGDIVVARRDMGTSYHLAVVIDDAHQGVTHVTRGEDLFEATKIHVLLQRLLGLLTPVYHHHRLIRDDAGKRLAKRDDARAIAKYRADGATPEDIRRMVGL
ncbi:MAG: tRNA glutamyl-Q(34) synthetase GluQRS [Pseudomonadota bacterium]